MLKVLCILGTRPEAIKLAPVVLELKKHPDVFETVLCVTAQHREMLDQVLRIFNIVPDIDLNLMELDQDLHTLTSRVIVNVGSVLAEQKPDVVLIQGDTTTVMVASLAAFYHRVPVGHVEAGLRTTNIYSPFPEEMNRRLTSVMTSFHFAPTDKARKALIDEGICEEHIFVTGNTVIDALQMIVRRARSTVAETLLSNIGVNGAEDACKLVLVTAHRRENFGERFEHICRGLKSLAERNSDVAILYPVHLNPQVQRPVHSILRGVDRVHLIEPVEYNVMAHLMDAAHLVLTDSGGIQEEAPALGKPVLVLRTETERPEAVEAGVAKVIGPWEDAIVRETERLLHDESAYMQMAKRVCPYGDGHAAKRIVNILKAKLG